MSYERQPPRGPRRKIIGIIMLFVSLVATAIIANVGYIFIADFFSSVQQNTNSLPATPQNIINGLITQVNNAFGLTVTLLIVAAVGGIIMAIFRLQEPEETPIQYS